jgi:diguanylate cyclase (GGDEF)-like protein/PAS domain S-box-containing protein
MLTSYLTASVAPPPVSWRSIEFLSTGLLIVDGRQVIVEGNTAALNLLGRSRDEVIGNTASAVFDQFDSAGRFHQFLGSFEQGAARLLVESHRQVLVEGHGPTGEPVWLSIEARSCRLDDGGHGFALQLQDVSDLQALQHAEERLRIIIDHQSDVLFELDLDAAISWVSPSVAEKRGWLVEELVGRSIFDFTHPEDCAVVREVSSAVLAQRDCELEARFLLKSGVYAWSLARGRALIDEHGRTIGAIVTLQDINAEVEARLASHETAERLRLMMDAAPVALALLDLDGHFLEVNPALCALLGRGRETLLGDSGEALFFSVHPDALGALGQNGEDQKLCSVINERGETRHLSMKSVVVRDADGKARSTIAVYVDITEHHDLEERLAYLASHDALTQLVNRSELLARAERILTHEPRSSTNVAVLFVDVDLLKAINDRHGHRAGDQVLREVGKRLTASCRSSDTVARIGGDEFAVLLVGLHRRRDLELISSEILRAFTSPISLDGEDLVVGVSVGAVFMREGQQFSDALQLADNALYRAKQSGRGRAVLHEWADDKPATNATP